jgi:hypothetical protein
MLIYGISGIKANQGNNMVLVVGNVAPVDSCRYYDCGIVDHIHRLRNERVKQ